MSGEPVSIRIADGVAWVTIDHPPINLLDRALIRALGRAMETIANDDGVRVVVLQSANPDFFVAHADVNMILGGAGRDGAAPVAAKPFSLMVDGFRTMPKATIGKINGLARGGGLELLAALDMRFCSLENTRLAQPEVPLGIIAAGGGSSRWPRLIGYARAMELLLGGGDIDGATAEKYGMVNRAMPATQLDAFVDDLARRIAVHPPHAVALAKRVAQFEGTFADTLDLEARSYGQAAAHPEAIAAMQRFMDAGGQTREIELGDPFASLGDPLKGD